MGLPESYVGGANRPRHRELSQQERDLGIVTGATGTLRLDAGFHVRIPDVAFVFSGAVARQDRPR